MHAEFFQILADVVEDAVEAGFEDDLIIFFAQQLFSAVDQFIDVFFLVAAGWFVSGNVLEDFIGRKNESIAVLCLNTFGDVVDVVALVAVDREGEFDIVDFQITQPDAGAEDIHLATGIVDIIFTVDSKTHRAHQRCQRGTVGRAAPVTDVQWTGGVGGNKFDLYFFAVGSPAFTKAVAASEDVVDDV